MARAKEPKYRILAYDGDYKSRDLLASHSGGHRLQRGENKKGDALKAAEEWMAKYPPQDSSRDRKPYIEITSRGYREALWESVDGVWVEKINHLKPKSRKKNPSLGHNTLLLPTRARKKNPSGTLVFQGSFMEWPYEIYRNEHGGYDGWIEGDKLAAINRENKAQAVDKIKKSIRAYQREGDIPAHKYTTWERIWGRKRPELSYEDIKQIQREEGLRNPKKKRSKKKSSKKRTKSRKRNPVSLRSIMAKATK